MPANIKSDWLIKINKQKTTTTKREHSCSCSTLGVLKIWGISIYLFLLELPVLQILRLLMMFSIFMMNEVGLGCSLLGELNTQYVLTSVGT